METAVMVLLMANCFVGSSAILTGEAATPPLKYLLPPPLQPEVAGRRGENVTLPCVLKTRPAHFRIKWTKVEPENIGPENIVIISNTHSSRRYGALGPRAAMRRAHAMDASLLLSRLQLEDSGRYRCELVSGVEDESVLVTLRVEGVVFPYQSESGRYKFTFHQAKAACEEQDGRLATFDQLFRAWWQGLDWCNAGWILDGTVTYPILEPRPNCGGDLPPGLRGYGPKDKDSDRFDAFCFTSSTEGSVFYVSGAFSFQEAGLACKRHGSELALVGQLYAAWHFQKLDQCDGGWLKDGSVRFPIIAPRRRCGGIQRPSVHSFGFPDKTLQLYGAYCYK